MWGFLMATAMQAFMPGAAHCVPIDTTVAVTVGWDYSNGLWVAEHGDGRVIGYSRGEDDVTYVDKGCV